MLKETEEGETSIEDDEDSTSPEIHIKLHFNAKHASKMTFSERLQYINTFIFHSKLANKESIKLEATFEDDGVIWKVRRPDVVVMSRVVNNQANQAELTRLSRTLA